MFATKARIGSISSGTMNPDHGNATLYCRQSGVNHELWSIV